ncbi:unnamed protein product, partial [Effrenium voratum]
GAQGTQPRLVSAGRDEGGPAAQHPVPGPRLRAAPHLLRQGAGCRPPRRGGHWHGVRSGYCMDGAPDGGGLQPSPLPQQCQVQLRLLLLPALAAARSGGQASAGRLQIRGWWHQLHLENRFPGGPRTPGVPRGAECGDA